MRTDKSNHEKAIVIGSGIAGLLAARVLSAHFDRVTVIERDLLPETPTPRSGVPQAHHIHAMLAKGRQVLEQLDPGLDAELEGYGAVLHTWGLDTHILTTGGYLPQKDTGIQARGHSRTMLEWHIRRRVQQMPNVDFLTGCQVTDLIVSENTVTGVQVMQGDSQTQLSAGLVVDASGRHSQTAQWLAAQGYAQPKETCIDSFLGYATRWYRIPDGMTLDAPGVLIQPGAKAGLYRGAAAARIEDRQVIVTLAGQNQDYPPTDEDGFLAFARSLPDPMVANWIETFEPITPIQGFRAANRLRRYDRLKRYPERFIVIGDAVCTLNPIYGQGMTVAALQAQVLSKLLTQQKTSDLSAFARRFHKRQWRVTRIPWLLATGEDRRYPLVEGAHPTIFDRILHRYIDLLFLASAQDWQLACALLRTTQLLDHPVKLFHPRVLVGAMRAWVQQRIKVPTDH